MRQRKLKTKTADKPLTAAQRKKIEEFRKRVAQANAERLREFGIIAGDNVEIR